MRSAQHKHPVEDAGSKDDTMGIARFIKRLLTKTLIDITCFKLFALTLFCGDIFLLFLDTDKYWSAALLACVL